MRVRELQHGDAFRFETPTRLTGLSVPRDGRTCVAWHPFVPSDVRPDVAYLWLPFPASVLETEVALVARWDGYLRDLPVVDRERWPDDCDRCGKPAARLFSGVSCSAARLFSGVSCSAARLFSGVSCSARCCYERR